MVVRQNLKGFRGVLISVRSFAGRVGYALLLYSEAFQDEGRGGVLMKPERFLDGFQNSSSISNGVYSDWMFSKASRSPKAVMTSSLFNRVG
jgi:hypothetical protein